jgi:hypothetical protein
VISNPCDREWVTLLLLTVGYIVGIGTAVFANWLCDARFHGRSTK